jgi:hypothetical protein
VDRLDVLQWGSPRRYEPRSSDLLVVIVLGYLCTRWCKSLRRREKPILERADCERRSDRDIRHCSEAPSGHVSSQGRRLIVVRIANHEDSERVLLGSCELGEAFKGASPKQRATPFGVEGLPYLYVEDLTRV